MFVHNIEYWGSYEIVLFGWFSLSYVGSSKAYILMIRFNLAWRFFSIKLFYFFFLLFLSLTYWKQCTHGLAMTDITFILHRYDRIGCRFTNDRACGILIILVLFYIYLILVSITVPFSPCPSRLSCKCEW